MKLLTMLIAIPLAAQSPAVTLTWAETAFPPGSTLPPGTAYSIYRSTGTCVAPTFGKLASAILPQTYTDTAVQPGNYCYQVTATAPGIPETLPSNAALAIVPAVVPPPPPACPASSSATWLPMAFPVQQTAAFTVMFTAVPSQAATDAVVGLSNGPATGYPSMAAIVRFAPSGNIDARNGGSYAANVAFPYAPGINYHVRMVVDPTRQVYDAFVTGPTGPEVKIASTFAFRTEQALTTSLNFWSIHSNTPTSGSITVCNFTLGVAPPPPPPPLPTVSGFSCVAAGLGSTCTVNLTGIAPKGGMIVTVSFASGASVTTLPVAIAAGVNNGSFRIQ
jgi:hypothetical protein